MKKFIAVVFVCCLVFALCACSGGEQPAKAWADKEILEYDIKKDDGSAVGNMVVTTERNPGDKSLNGKDYNADGRMTIEINATGYAVKTVMLTNMYTVLATEKTYTDSENEENNYVLNARHDGKYYYYSYDGGAEKRIKVGRSGYTDSEFVYWYIRCFPLSSPPSLKIADPATGRSVSVSAVSAGTKNYEVPFPSGTKAIDCTVVAISLSDAPKGKAISVSYTPDSKEYSVSGLSIASSRKMPVEIVENDITYTLKSITVA